MDLRKLVLTAGAVFGAMAATAANALTISSVGTADANGRIGQTLTSVSGLDLIFTFTSRSASFNSNLNLVFGDQFVFSNSVAAGTTAIRTGPAAGMEAQFRIFVTNTGNNFFSGNRANNSDNFVHALITDLGFGLFRVAFEDLPFPGSDADYNDFVFTVREVPIPGAAVLLLSGLAGFGFAARRKAQRIAA